MSNNNADSRREAFELFAITSAWLAADAEDMQRDGDGYLGMEVHSSWLAWNAALDSLCIELPQPMRIPDEDEYDGDYEAYEIEESHAITMNRLLSECKESIHAAGVKTK